ncbi:E3 ubiquitin-protein ligase RNF181-like isoform X2 [Centruroides vittatus]|uniref:E3 ubiquitin-protein ligase RNF181-like isoform X2 n=1 Tax=Centruroides vittatus TaxID=120091 RepID=UPI0035107214
MSSYFDEHNCEFGETPNNFLHLVRLLLDSGLAAEFQIEYEQLFGDGRSHPPASKSFVEKLKTITDFPKDRQCPVCMKEFEEGDIGKQLPCQHLFHASCISPWLNIVYFTFFYIYSEICLLILFLLKIIFTEQCNVRKIINFHVTSSLEKATYIIRNEKLLRKLKRVNQTSDIFQKYVNHDCQK